MTKSVLIYTIIIIFVGVAIWFFSQKVNDVSNSENGLAGSDLTSSPTAIPTPTAMVLEDTGEWVKLDSGLQMQDIVVGQGQEAKAGNAVATHYSGTLEDGTKFDSSYDRGEPFAFLLGAGQVIKGWDLGVEGMKVGGKRKLIIPPDLAYGEKGAGGAIPPNATLYFDIELVAVQIQGEL